MVADPDSTTLTDVRCRSRIVLSCPNSNKRGDVDIIADQQLIAASIQHHVTVYYRVVANADPYSANPDTPEQDAMLTNRKKTAIEKMSNRANRNFANNRIVKIDYRVAEEPIRERSLRAFPPITRRRILGVSSVSPMCLSLPAAMLVRPLFDEMATHVRAWQPEGIDTWVTQSLPLVFADE